MRRIKEGEGKADFVFVDGPYAGKTVDFLFTARNERQAHFMNRFFATNNWENNRKQIFAHVDKADIIPMDLRHIDASSRAMVIEMLYTELTKEERMKFIIMH